MSKIKRLLRRIKAESRFPAVLLHLQGVSQLARTHKPKTRCTITQTIIEGKFERGESVRFPIDLFNPWNNSIKMPSITWTGKCNKCYYIWTGQEKCCTITQTREYFSELYTLAIKLFNK